MPQLSISYGVQQINYLIGNWDAWIFFANFGKLIISNKKIMSAANAGPQMSGPHMRISKCRYAIPIITRFTHKS